MAFRRKKNKQQRQPTQQQYDINSREYWLEQSQSKGQQASKTKKKKRLFYPIKKTIALYDELLYSLFAGEDSLNGRVIYNDPERIGIDFIGSYENENVTFYYLIDKFPQFLRIDWKNVLREACAEGVRISFIEEMNGHRIQWQSPEMKSRLRTLRKVKEGLEDEDIDVYNLNERIEDMSNQEWIEASLRYLSDADRVRKRQMFKTSILMLVTGRRGENFNDTIARIHTVADGLEIGIQRIMYEIPDYIQHYSPFRNDTPKSIDGQIPYKVIPDELLSRFSTYAQGIVGFGDVYFGTDIYSRFPVLKTVKRNPEDAENWVITAVTGGGKSAFVKALILQLLGKGYNGTIMDIEGREYAPIGNFVSHNSKVQVVNMAEGNGKYFDPVEITPKTGIEDIDKDAKNLSINFTVSLLQVLLGKFYEENRIMDNVINDAILEVYRDAGVTEDMDTWADSKGLTLKDIYRKITELHRKQFRDDREYLSAAQEAEAVLSKYFEPDGVRASLFREKINVEDLKEADLVICSFGMEGKSEITVDAVQMALMQLGAAQLSHQRSIFSKTRGKFNFKVWEEFQRWGKFPNSDKTLGVAVTGGRKLGDVNIVITNEIGKLLDDDKFGIFANTTSFMCGAIPDAKVRKEFCTRLSVTHMIPELDKIGSSKGINSKEQTQFYIDEKGNEVVQNVTTVPRFLVGLDKKDYSIVEMLIPTEIVQSDLFRTGVKTKIKVVGEDD